MALVFCQSLTIKYVALSLPSVLYGRKSGSPTLTCLMAGCLLRCLLVRVKKCHNLNSVPGVIKMTRLRTVGWEWHAARIG